MLLGRLPNNLKLDAKGRLTVPSRIREEVAGEGEPAEFFIGALLDPCLYLHTEDQHQRFLEAFAYAVDDTAEGRLLKTLVHSSFVPVTTDGAGRVNVPQDLLERAGIVKEVVVVGMQDRFELWGIENFRGLREGNLEQFRKGLEEALRRVGEARRAPDGGAP